MGFQNGINQVLGAAGNLATTAAVIKEVNEKKTEQGELAKQQYHEAKADITKMQGEQKQATDTINLAAGKDSNGNEITSEQGKFYQSQALTEKEAAQRAFDELADRIEAKKAMMSRAEKIMKRTNTWGGMR